MLQYCLLEVDFCEKGFKYNSLAVPVICGEPRYSKMGGCDVKKFIEFDRWPKG